MSSGSSTTTTTTTTYAPRRRTKRAGDATGRGGSSTTGVEAKVVVMGSAGVGKTSLVQRYTTNAFNANKIAATAGAGFHVKKTVVDGVSTRLQLWDTAGQERFRSLAPMYYRGSHAAILVYDITSSSSFDDIKIWLEELKKNLPPDAENDMIIYIVGTKADLARQRRVHQDYVRSSLRSWFPPPKPPTPPPRPSISSALMPYYGSAYPFNSSSSLTSSSHFGQQLTSLSTSVSTHLIPTMPSFHLGLPHLPNLNGIRPRFYSLTGGVKPQGTSPTSVDTDTTTNTNASSAITIDTASSSAMSKPSSLSAQQRVAFPRSTTTSAVQDLAGPSNSGFKRPLATSTSGLVEFPSLVSPPGLLRRNSAHPAPQSGMRPSASMGGKFGRPRLNSWKSDDGEERGRERRPATPTAASSGDEVGLARSPSARWAARRPRDDSAAKRQAQAEEALDDDDDSVDDGVFWSFSKEVEIMEVSAKDGVGIEELFQTLLKAIIKRRDAIDKERKLRERDSVMLNVPTTVPSWGALPEEDDGGPGHQQNSSGRSSGWGACCRI